MKLEITIERDDIAATPYRWSMYEENSRGGSKEGGEEEFLEDVFVEIDDRLDRRYSLHRDQF